MADTRMQLEDWLDDLCARFVLNVPQEDLSTIQRICFQLEEAQWFYEDFIRPLDPSLPSMSLRSFCMRIFQHCPLTSNFSASAHEAAFDEFLLYKVRVPVRGAIMLNHDMDSVVLVKGWKKGANWSFPRGKINKDENDLVCAIREVYEETGFDIKEAGLVPADDQVKYIEITMREQQMRLYVFRDVPMDTHFEPRTRKEISKIEWYHLSQLPAFRKKGGQQPNNGVEAAKNANKFYMVAPFLVPLKKWIVQQKKLDESRHAGGRQFAPNIEEGQFTEEEHFVSQADPFVDGYISKPDASLLANVDRTEGATDAFQRLLQIQPSEQGLQPDGLAMLQTSTSTNSGEALLALLHAKPQGGIQRSSQPPPPQTPFDPYGGNIPMPTTPHHHHPMRPPPFSTLPPPPAFPFQPHYNQLPFAGFPQHFAPQYPPRQVGPGMYFPPQMNYDTPQHIHHALPPQHLQHPQPLPPQVQRAVFTDSQSHSPVIPQGFVPPQNSKPASRSIAVSQPEFPGLHAPVVPPVVKEPSAKLTHHSLALLNAFKGQTQATTSAAQHPEVSNIKAEDPASLTGAEQSGQQSQLPHTSGNGIATATIPIKAAKPPVNEEHRSSLLNMFRSPNPKSVAVEKNHLANTRPSNLPAPENVTAFTTPQKAAFIPSQAAETSDGLSPRGNQANGRSDEQSTAASFRPVSILTRPQETSSAGLLSHEPALAKSSKARDTQPADSPRSEAVGASGSSKAEVFQPQILRRPQSTSTTIPVEFVTASSPAPVATTGHAAVRGIAQPQAHKQNLLSLFGTSKATTAPVQPTSEPLADPRDDRPKNNESLLSLFGPSAVGTGSTQPRGQPLADRASNQSQDKQKLLSLFGMSAPTRPKQPEQHTQDLLALFGKSAENVPSASATQPTVSDHTAAFKTPERPAYTAERSRVGSLASNGAESRRDSQTPISPEDKGFLLGYLDAVAKGSGR